MTGLDVVLVMVFAAIWLVPLALAVRWELRLRGHHRAALDAAAPSRPARTERRREVILR